jgi:predicted oxidoreductase
VILLDQEPESSFGGQAWWSLGGLMFVDSPEQRRMRVKDSYELALQDWLGTAGFDRPEDAWPRRWAEAYVAFCAGEKRAWLHAGAKRSWRSWPGRSRSSYATLEAQIAARDRQVANPYAKDGQVTAIHGARAYFADKVTRVAEPHRILDPEAGPLIAVRLWTLTRKSLGGLQTDLSSRVLRGSGEPLDGLYAAGELAGFGGGGMHGYRALEGTFLGGCLFSGRIAGRAAAAAVG